MKDIDTLRILISRVSNEYYRLSDFAYNKNLDPQLARSIDDLGDMICHVSDLIEYEDENLNENIVRPKNTIVG